MDSVERNINDVEFGNLEHCGTNQFRSYIRSLVEDGSLFVMAINTRNPLTETT